MESLVTLLRRLPLRHRRCLRWFISNTGTEQPWPKPLTGGVLLATRAKGIYKPAWTEYALSVRQTLKSLYADREPVTRPDGTWSYDYFQEKRDLEARDSLFTNLAMLKARRDQVPVGVMKQTREQPRARYRVLGVALVTGWEAGYFQLEGFNTKGYSQGLSVPRDASVELEVEGVVAQASGAFDSRNIADARERTLSAIVRRRGQPQFRQELMQAYGARCAITGCDAPDALEAAHIQKYRGPATNHLANGLLLRADLHTLFDLGLISIDSRTMTVLVSRELAHTYYEKFEGAKILMPENPLARPSTEALDAHRAEASL